MSLLRASVLLAAILGFSIFTAPSLAQGNSSPNSAQYSNPTTRYYSSRSRQPRKPEHTASEWVTAPLKTAPQLPFLPEYKGNGTKFQQGSYTPNLRTSTTYFMNFLCKEPANQVRTSFENALKGNGWTVKFYGKDESNMEARLLNRGLTCTAVVAKTSVPGYRTSLAIRYIDKTKTSAQYGR